MKARTLIMIAFVSCCSCEQQRPNVNITNQPPIENSSSEIGRFQMVGLRDEYPSVSNDILLDTKTGETWYLTWSHDKEIGNYFSWEKTYWYAKSPLSRYLDKVKDELAYDISKRAWNTASQHLKAKFPNFEAHENEITELITDTPELSDRRDKLNETPSDVHGKEALLEEVYKSVMAKGPETNSSKDAAGTKSPSLR